VRPDAPERQAAVISEQAEEFERYPVQKINPA